MNIGLVLLIIATVAIYVNIGYAFGCWNWQVFYRLPHNKDRITKWILWPFTSWKYGGDLHLAPPSQAPIIDSYSTARSFELTMSIVWPIKIIYNLLILLVMGLLLLFWRLLKSISSILLLITYPIRSIAKLKDH